MFKMTKRLLCAVIALFFVVAVASACGSATPQVVEVTREIPVTVIVTQIVQVVVTATPPPFTPTPQATPTPQFTATSAPTVAPVFQKWASDQVVDAFRSAGLGIADARPVTKDDYGMAPMTAAEGTRFLIPSLCPDCGGRIFSFTSQADLAAMETYYVELGRSSAAFFSWVFVKDNILVQINGDLAEDKAKGYQAALNELK